MNDYFWHGAGTPQGKLLTGIVGEENADHPGTYRFSSTCGIVVNDAHVLSPDADNKGGGETTKPRPGSLCAAFLTSNGAQCLIAGFQRAPFFDEEKDEIPSVGNPDDNQSSGDKVYKTAGGATLVLKRGGALFVESGPGVSIVLNPLNNSMSLRSANYKVVADGYSARRGRQEIGGTEPETFHQEDFLHLTGPIYDRFRVQHGNLSGGGRRQLELASVVVAAGQTSVTVKTRETYDSDGKWFGEGPEYKWGDEEENAVLGNQLVDAIKELTGIIKGLKVNTAWGPSTPPLPTTIAKLQSLEDTVSARIKSKYIFFSKEKPVL